MYTCIYVYACVCVCVCIYGKCNKSVCSVRMHVYIYYKKYSCAGVSIYVHTAIEAHMCMYVCMCTNV